MYFIDYLLATTLLFPAYVTPAPQPIERRQSNAAVGAIVNTTVGQIQGTASPLRPEVSAYLGIRYAQAPVGSLRFAAPVAVGTSSAVIDGTKLGADCPCNRIPTQEASLAGPAGSKILIAEAQTGNVLSEDCLTVNVWTKPQTGEAKKAVLFWIYGGGFSTGNSACPLYDGAVLADENDVVVVSINYRLNIFGFPVAPSTPPNVGLLDQRLALEWARDNVAAFGGDPTRITLFGQSAGGASVDYLSYAYIDDPIAHAMIPQSGVSNGILGGGTASSDNWYNVSQTLGCGGSEAGASTVDCVRSKSMDEVLAAIEPLATLGLMSGFGPTTDGVTVVGDFVAKGEAGEFAKLPMLTGSTDDEAGFILLLAIAYTSLTELEEDLLSPLVKAAQPILDLATLFAFTCGAGQATGFRAQAGVPTWRYRYYGGSDYDNTDVKFIGSAYHTGELPLLFGTAASVTGMADSTAETAFQNYMRNAWTTFAKDPVNGLNQLSWPQGSSSIVRLAYNDETTASFIPTSDTDSSCSTVFTVENLATQLFSIISSLTSVLSSNSSADRTGVIQELQQLSTSLEAASSTEFSSAVSGIDYLISFLDSSKAIASL